MLAPAIGFEYVARRETARRNQIPQFHRALNRRDSVPPLLARCFLVDAAFTPVGRRSGSLASASGCQHCLTISRAEDSRFQPTAAFPRLGTGRCPLALVTRRDGANLSPGGESMARSCPVATAGVADVG
jgi:hypothetical protein